MASKRGLRVSQLLLAGLVAYVSAAAAATVSLQSDTDRMGSDYKGFALDQADPQACRQACTDDAMCKSYTYVKPGVKGPQAMCFLKNAVPPARPNDCCSSGEKSAGTISMPAIKLFGASTPTTALKTLVPGSGAPPKMPAVKTPADLPPQKLMALTGGQFGQPFAHLAADHMSEPGHGHIWLIGPDWVMAGSGEEPNYVNFPADSVAHHSGLQMQLNPGSSALLLVDCAMAIPPGSDAQIMVSQQSGPKQIFKATDLVEYHLLFMVNSPGSSSVDINVTRQWDFHGCDVRKL